uniref:Uncharacterized protein n=1 Tax=Sus scrofa TaxID=9823 RepID=A0A4X1UMP7_PIG
MGLSVPLARFCWDQRIWCYFNPQDPHVLACWPCSSNCLPALTHPSDSACLRVNLKTLSLLNTSPIFGRLGELWGVSSFFGK